MQHKKKLIVACATLAVTAFGIGASLQHAPVVTAETNTNPILYYDFSAETIVANANGYSTVQNLGTKANANATIFNGTGVRAYDKLVFNQPSHDNAEAGKAKGFFELPTQSFDGLTAFTVQMEINAKDAGAAREPIIAMTQSSLTETGFGDYNQGILFGDGWINSDTTYMESWIGGWNIAETSARPFIKGVDYMLTMVYDGTNVSFYYDNTLLIQKTQTDTSFFGGFDYFRIGGRMMDWTGGLHATIDNVKLYDYARSTSQLADDAAALSARVTENKYAKVYYDFSNADEKGVVKNLGTGENLDGKIVQTKNDVRIEDGKLVVANDTTVADKNNGYFRLPDNLFKGSEDWSIVMDVDRLVCLNNQPAMFYFGAVDPTTKTDDELNATNFLQLFLMDNMPYYQATGGGADNLWTGGTANVINNPEDGQRTIALIYKDGVASLYYYQKYENGVTPTKIFQTPKAVNFYYWDMLFNKIGGYIYSWGRSSSDLKIDSFAFFDYAITTGTITNFPLNVEYITATLPETATSLTSYACYNREGTKVNRTDLMFPENIDFSTVGVKEYVVWRSNVASQPTPIRFTLTTTHVDSNKDNECEGCGAIVDGIGKAHGINLGLNGTISVNIFMELTEATIADEGAYMHTEYGDKEFDISVKDAEVRDGLYAFSVEVPAKDVDQQITSYVVRSNGDTGVKYTYSVKEYAEKIAETQPETAALMDKLGAYGTYAKAFFAGESVEATEEMQAVTKETLDSFAHTVEGNVAGIQVLGMSLILESETTIRMYFSATNAIENYTFKIAEKEVEAKAGDGYYYLELTNINAKDLDTMYAFEISDGENNFTLTYSALSYARTAIATGDVELAKLAQALYLYNQASNAYFNN